MTSTHDEFAHPLDDVEHSGNYPIPFLDREVISHWRSAAPDSPIPNANRSLYAFEPMWENSFVTEATGDELNRLPKVGHLVFVQTGDLKDGELTAVLDDCQQLTLCVVHHCEETTQWYVQPVPGVPRTVVPVERLIGRVFKHIYL